MGFNTAWHDKRENSSLSFHLCDSPVTTTQLTLSLSTGNNGTFTKPHHSFLYVPPFHKLDLYHLTLVGVPLFKRLMPSGFCLAAPGVYGLWLGVSHVNTSHTDSPYPWESVSFLIQQGVLSFCEYQFFISLSDFVMLCLSCPALLPQTDPCMHANLLCSCTQIHWMSCTSVSVLLLVLSCSQNERTHTCMKETNSEWLMPTRPWLCWISLHCLYQTLNTRLQC